MHKPPEKPMPYPPAPRMPAIGHRCSAHGKHAIQVLQAPNAKGLVLCLHLACNRRVYEDPITHSRVTVMADKLVYHQLDGQAYIEDSNYDTVEYRAYLEKCIKVQRENHKQLAAIGVAAG